MSGNLALPKKVVFKTNSMCIVTRSRRRVRERVIGRRDTPLPVVFLYVL